jgi:hypothetical protein
MIAREVNAVDTQVRNSMVTEVPDIRPGHPLIQSRNVTSQYQHALFRDLHTLFEISNCLRLVPQLAKWVPHAASPCVPLHSIAACSPSATGLRRQSPAGSSGHRLVIFKVKRRARPALHGTVIVKCDLHFFPLF